MLIQLSEMRGLAGGLSLTKLAEKNVRYSDETVV